MANHATRHVLLCPTVFSTDANTRWESHLPPQEAFAPTIEAKTASLFEFLLHPKKLASFSACLLKVRPLCGFPNPASHTTVRVLLSDESRSCQIRPALQCNYVRLLRAIPYIHSRHCAHMRLADWLTERRFWSRYRSAARRFDEENSWGRDETELREHFWGQCCKGESLFVQHNIRNMSSCNFFTAIG